MPITDYARLPESDRHGAFSVIDLGRIAQAAFQFLGLGYAFSADWEVNHRTFEAADGGFWSNYGNEVAARTIASFIWENGSLELPDQTTQGE
jgi:hypothetical protein